MAAIVEITGVHKTYKTGSITFEALRGITLSIAEGEYIAITGPSGSGKSTLMNILGCLDIPTEGTYLLGGEDVSGMSERDLAVVRNKRIGLGIVAGQLLSKAINYPVIISIAATSLALAVSLIIGIVASVYPAWRAAKLAPIDALRNE